MKKLLVLAASVVLMVFVSSCRCSLRRGSCGVTPKCNTCVDKHNSGCKSCLSKKSCVHKKTVDPLADCPKCLGPQGTPKTTHAPSSEEAEIGTKEIEILVRSKSALIFDARSGKYDDGRRIPGANFLSYEASAEEVANVIDSKDKLIVTYCTNLQCPASAMLAKHLRELGYTNILEYPYGIEGWAAAGNEIEHAK